MLTRNYWNNVQITHENKNEKEIRPVRMSVFHSKGPYIKYVGGWDGGFLWGP